MARDARFGVLPFEVLGGPGSSAPLVPAPCGPAASVRYTPPVHEPRAPRCHLPPLIKWLVRPLALAAAGASAYLFALSLADRAPVGCGVESSCGEVLQSDWSKVLGVPVAGLAVALYLTVLVVTFVLARSARRPRRARRAWATLLCLASAAAAAGGWFVYLQLAVVGDLCPWCVGVHAAGLVLLLGVAISLLARGGRGTPEELRPLRPLTRRHAAVASVIGLAGAGALAGTQVLFPPLPEPPRVYRAALPGGPLELALNDVPTLGRPRASHPVAVVADYTCKHCRAVHLSLGVALAKHPEELCVAVLAVPMNIRCNRYMRRAPPPVHEHACELAKLSLAVYRAAPRAFPAFDGWLFEPEEPRGPAAARAKAVELVGADALARAEIDPWIADRLRRNADIWGDVGAKTVPVLILPGEVAAQMPEDAGWATTFLEAKLGLGRTR